MPAPNQEYAVPDAPEPLPDVTDLTNRLLAAGSGDVYRAVTRAVDAAVMAAAAARLGGNQVHMAKTLGISRTTIRTKIRSARMDIDGRRKSAGPPVA